MVKPLHVDLDGLRTQSTDFLELAESVRQRLTALQATLDAEGAFWGDDEPGRAFAKNYEPAVENDLTGMRNLADGIESFGAALGEAARAYGDSDAENADIVRRSLGADNDQYLPPQQYLPGTVPASPPPSAASEAPVENPIVPGIDEQGPAAQPPNTRSNSTVPEQESTQPYAPGNSGYATQPPPVSPAPFTPATTTTPNSPSPNVAAPAATAPDTRPPTPTAAPQARTTAAPPSHNPAPDPGRSITAPAGNPPGANRSSTVNSATPWTANSAPGPAQNSAVRAPSGAIAPTGAGGARGAGTPPPTPFVGQDRRNAQPEKNLGDRKAKDTAPQRGPRNKTTDANALQIIRELAMRHGFDVTGFEAGDLSEATATQLAAAVDKVLGEHPYLRLGGIALADLGPGRMAELNTGRAVGDAWIVLDRTAIGTPAMMSESVRAARKSGAMVTGSTRRPMYAVMCHQLARALVEAAPHAARSAHRCLVTEYYRVDGPWDGRSLAGVVAKFRRWRDQLGSGCYRGRRWDASESLVAGFAEVQIRGKSACRPAKALYRLLVETAGQQDYDSR